MAAVFLLGCLTLPDKGKLRLRSPVLKKQAGPLWTPSFVFNSVTPSQHGQACLGLMSGTRPTDLGVQTACGARPGLDPGSLVDVYRAQVRAWSLGTVTRTP